MSITMSSVVALIVQLINLKSQSSVGMLLFLKWKRDPKGYYIIKRLYDRLNPMRGRRGLLFMSSFNIASYVKRGKFQLDIVGDICDFYTHNPDFVVWIMMVSPSRLSWGSKKQRDTIRTFYAHGIPVYIDNAVHAKFMILWDSPTIYFGDRYYGSMNFSRGGLLDNIECFNYDPVRGRNLLSYYTRLISQMAKELFETRGRPRNRTKAQQVAKKCNVRLADMERAIRDMITRIQDRQTLNPLFEDLLKVYSDLPSRILGTENRILKLPGFLSVEKIDSFLVKAYESTNDAISVLEHYAWITNLQKKRRRKNWKTELELPTADEVIEILKKGQTNILRGRSHLSKFLRILIDEERLRKQMLSEEVLFEEIQSIERISNSISKLTQRERL